MATQHLKFGPKKYASFHLLLCRWLRHFAEPCEHRYVTMGGTELTDAISVAFIDRRLMLDALSYERDSARHALAVESCDRLERMGVRISTQKDDFFSYQRADERPHLFFIDLEGVFAWGNYHVQVGKMFQKGVIRERDSIIITSHLGHVPGWPRVFSTFDGEFRLLGIVEEQKKREWYRRAHPAFVTVHVPG